MKSFMRLAAALFALAVGPVLAQDAGAALGAFHGNVMVHVGADFVSAERGQAIAQGQEIVVGDGGGAMLRVGDQIYALQEPGTYHVTAQGGVVNAEGQPVLSATSLRGEGGEETGPIADTQRGGGGGGGGGAGGGGLGSSLALLAGMVGGAAWAENNAGSSAPNQPVSR
jgi:hypothetical protein